MNNIKQQNLKFGEKNEIELLDVFIKHIDPSLCRTNNYFEMDYESNKSFVELKSRNCRFSDYADTMIGTNKINFAEKCIKNVYFAFKFQDGLYIYKFNKNDIITGEIYFKIGGRTDRGTDERKKYAFIKTELLKEIII